MEGIYRIDDVDKVSRIITHEVIRPNGLAISPDDRYLFVAENVNSGDDPQNRKLWRFGLTPAGSVIPGTQKLLFDWGSDRGPDGMAIDQQPQSNRLPQVGAVIARSHMANHRYRCQRGNIIKQLTALAQDTPAIAG